MFTVYEVKDTVTADTIMDQFPLIPLIKESCSGSGSDQAGHNNLRRRIREISPAAPSHPAFSVEMDSEK